MPGIEHRTVVDLLAADTKAIHLRNASYWRQIDFSYVLGATPWTRLFIGFRFCFPDYSYLWDNGARSNLVTGYYPIIFFGLGTSGSSYAANKTDATGAGMPHWVGWRTSQVGNAGFADYSTASGNDHRSAALFPRTIENEVETVTSGTTFGTPNEPGVALPVLMMFDRTAANMSGVILHGQDYDGVTGSQAELIDIMVNSTTPSTVASYASGTYGWTSAASGPISQTAWATKESNYGVLDHFEVGSGSTRYASFQLRDLLIRPIA